ncbi:MAG TPA: ABC transporter permease [Actinoallomurus sp.]|jgi:hypothetical protein
MTSLPVPATTRARDVLAAEWLKLRTVRSTYLMLLLAVAGTAAVGLFATARAKVDSPVYFDAVEISLSGAVISQLAFGVFGALAITTEHTTGMIRTTFAAVPRRRAVLAAKATVTGLLTLAVGEVIAFGTFFLGQRELSSAHLDVGLADPGVLRAVAGAGFYLFVMAVVGLCLGTIIRHTAGAIAAIGVIFIEPLFVLTGFPAWLKDSVLWWAGQAIMSSRPRPGYPSASLGFIVCGVYAVLGLAAATFVITRRDA